MTNPVDIVKRMDEAFRNKDEATLRETLHPDYIFCVNCRAGDDKNQSGIGKELLIR
jgi:hypothetical protein